MPEGASSEADAADRPAYCSICGAPHQYPDSALDYPNAVCDACDERAVNAAGEAPQSHVAIAVDGSAKTQEGDNPVFIDGIRCWRRYRFGGHVTLRDAFDCDTIEELWERHRTSEGYLQVFNSPNLPGKCIGTARVLLQTANPGGPDVSVWGMLSMETGDIIARNAIVEKQIGRLKDAFEVFQYPNADEAELQDIRTDPTRLLSFYYSFGAQAHRPKALYLTPELDRPISGRDGIVETGALRGLRTHDAGDRVFELGIRPAEECAVFHDIDESTNQAQVSLGEMAVRDTPEGLTLTVRYELPFRLSGKTVRQAGIDIAVSVLREVVAATEQTHYTSLTSLPAVDIHTYHGQRKVMTVAVDAEAVSDTEWDNESSTAADLRDLARVITRFGDD